MQVLINVFADTEYDLAHYFTGEGGGGIAYVGTVCDKEWALGVSGIHGRWQGDHTKSGSNWDLLVTAHELGHNLGSPHTHNYSPPIDQCYDPVKKQVDSCVGVEGTLMGYCHLCPNLGVNGVNMHYHPTVIAKIKSETEQNCGPTGPPTTSEPTPKPTSEPIAKPTSEPTAKPTSEPTAKPTSEPTAKPTSEPTTAKPTSEPTDAKRENPTIEQIKSLKTASPGCASCDMVPCGWCQEDCPYSGCMDKGAPDKPGSTNRNGCAPQNKLHGEINWPTAAYPKCEPGTNPGILNYGETPPEGKCRKSVPQSLCTSTGDPHFRTFKGATFNSINFDFQEAGIYKLLESEADKIAVHQYQYPWTGKDTYYKGATSIIAVGVTVGAQTMEIYGNTLTVNGAQVDEALSVYADGSQVVTTTSADGSPKTWVITGPSNNGGYASLKITRQSVAEELFALGYYYNLNQQENRQALGSHFNSKVYGRLQAHRKCRTGL